MIPRTRWVNFNRWMAWLPIPQTNLIFLGFGSTEGQAAGAVVELGRSHAVV